MRIVAVLAFTSIALLASSASAAPPGGTPPVASPPTNPGDTNGYHAPMLLVDAAAVTIAIASQGNAPVLGFAALTYVLGPAVVHVAYGHGGRAAASVGLRVGLPVGALLLYRAMDRCTPPDNDIDACGDEDYTGLIAFGGGMLVAMVADNLLLGGDTLARAGVTPVVSSAHGVSMLGMRGSF